MTTSTKVIDDNAFFIREAETVSFTGVHCSNNCQNSRKWLAVNEYSSEYIGLPCEHCEGEYAVYDGIETYTQTYKKCAGGCGKDSREHNVHMRYSCGYNTSEYCDPCWLASGYRKGVSSVDWFDAGEYGEPEDAY